MNHLKRWWIERKLRNRQIRELDLMRQLRISERNGKIWIVCNGVAVNEIPTLSSAKDIVTILTAARKAAVEYEKE